MDTSRDLVLSAVWLTSRVIFFGTLGLYLAILGNPRVLRQSITSINALNTWPPTTLFRWRKREPYLTSYEQGEAGYEAIVYNAETDEEEVTHGAFRPYTWSPTFLLWRKKRPQPKDAMLRIALIALVVHSLFFVSFFVGSFCLLGWLATTESWRWLVAVQVLAVHQFVFARTHTYIVWMRSWLYGVIGLGVWVYLQGGVLETIAVCTVGVLITIAIVGQSYMVKSERFRTMRTLELGPFDPTRRRRLW